MACGAVASTAFMQAYPGLVLLLGRTTAPPPADERTIVALAATVFSAFVLAAVDRGLRLGWLSALAQRVAFVLMPPLILIFLVLGTIYIGLATPTEAGALGVLGALAMAAGRRRLQRVALIEASLTALKLSCFVIFILIGSTIFTHTFNSLDGSIWVAQALGGLPGGATGMLVFVMALVFVLGFFLDFFEIAFVLVPLLAPVAEAFGIDLVWFGVLLCINLQTSFLTPPFGYALFFLRGVTPHEDRVDASGRRIRGVSTAEIYRGALPFTAVPVAVMALLIAFPGLVLLSAVPATMSEAEVERILRRAEPGPDPARAVDPAERLLEAIGRER
jgi:tripartite ATP-independent transporter DctM subunit